MKHGSSSHEDEPDKREPPTPETGLPGDPDVDWDSDGVDDSLAGDPSVDYE